MPPVVMEIAALVSLYCGIPYSDAPNSVNLNFYKNGTDSVGFHADDEALFYDINEARDRQHIKIISLSIGATRTFIVSSRKIFHFLFIYFLLNLI